MILEVIKETIRYGHTVGRMGGRSVGQTDGSTANVKTVFPPTNTVFGGIISISHPGFRMFLTLPRNN